MKASKYNYIIEHNKSHLIFNGLTRKWILIPEDTVYEELLRILAYPDNYFENVENRKLLRKLKYGGFIIEHDVNEQAILANTAMQYRQAKHAHICILTTYECNLRCWYCVQKHKREFMTEDTKERIKLFLKRSIDNDDWESLTLSWFGGEPLMHPEVIYDISKYAKELCLNHNIPFNNGITTNGTLINEHIIEMFKKISLTHFQITIDGNKANHNKTKKNKAIDDPYTTVCTNIQKLLDNIDESDITIRYNYTSKNLSHDVASDLINSFQPLYRNKLEFLPRQVWQEDDESIDKALLSDVINEIEDSGFKVNKTVDINNIFCYAESNYFLTIFNNGLVDKCANMPPQKAIGFLNESGEICWNSDVQSTYKNLWESKSPCLQCKYLPLCMGPCPIKRRNAIENGEPFNCIFSNSDKHFQELILNYISSFK